MEGAAHRGRSPGRWKGGVEAPAKEGSGISVFVRMRPAVEGEETEPDAMRAIKLLPDGCSVFIKDRFVDKKEMTFTKAFGPDTTQHDLYMHVGRPAVHASLAGQNGTILAYGQTGTGKTYTVFEQGAPREGLMVKCVKDIFSQVTKDTDHEWTVTMQYVQMYNDTVMDLLATDVQNTTLAVREDTQQGTYVSGAVNTVVGSAQEVLDLFSTANSNRVVRLTKMNAKSSRSHAIFVLGIQRSPRFGGGQVVCGKLTIVDLAGSERIKRTKADGVQRSEAQAINLSLACLGNVIHALAEPQGKKHVPYRDSKLTRLLQDSLGEYGHASIVVTFSPCLADITETMSSLQFGQRALRVRYQHKGPRLAVDLKALTRQLQEAVRTLTLRETELQGKCERLESENSRLRDTVDEDEKLIDEMEGHIKRYVGKVNKLQADIQDKHEEIADLRATTTTTTLGSTSVVDSDPRGSPHEASMQEAAFAEERASLLLCHAAELQKLRGVVERQQQQYEEKIERLQFAVDTVTAEKTAVQSDLECAGAQVSELLSQLSEAREQLAKRDEEVSSLTAELAAVKEMKSRDRRSPVYHLTDVDDLVSVCSSITDRESDVSLGAWLPSSLTSMGMGVAPRQALMPIQSSAVNAALTPRTK